MSELRQANWVSVKDRLPETSKRVLVHIHEVESNDDYVDFAYYISESKKWDFVYGLKPTYYVEYHVKLEIRAWMDIPSPSNY